ncbi:RNA-guided endonuclease IscB [Ktedonobacter racemifer]|uniref:HNH endonuclease n=1 Tax=Ktedonobacter racemifer DSM 44963 TaxID=485913 RepID=D6U473_KTERA|nr:RNA-guided endonuclease IscB [Ktedonobacter racemifer]EFH81303.1 HNH endonuclease [Ktedonobacter racemifer DSM 44963]
MSRILIVDQQRRPLMPTTPARARLLLKSRKAAILRRFPLVLILKEARPEAVVEPLRVKLDPGSQTSGIAVVNERSGEVVWAAELTHRSQAVHEALSKRRAARRSRRSRHTRYRAARFANRRRPKGWLAPSLLSRVQHLLCWAKRLARWCPVGALSLELVRFDLALLQTPSLEGVDYQRGTLWGTEVRQYLLAKWEHRCAYCQATGVPLEIDHVVPQSRGGSDRIANLVIACHTCNQCKADQTLEAFLADRPEVLARVQAQRKAPLRDAAAVNSTRWALYENLKTLGMPLETGSGGLTKWNRTSRNLPKRHWIDAACCGRSTPERLRIQHVRPSLIEARGRQARRMVNVDEQGFPVGRAKGPSRVQGFRTGDLVRARVTRGKKVGVYVGRVAIKTDGYFKLTGRPFGMVEGIHARYCTPLHQKDGYAYSQGEAALPPQA